MTKMIVANWKLYLSPQDSLKFFKNLRLKISNQQSLEIVICPSFLVLSNFISSINNLEFGIRVGAQDCFWEKRGAFTGEVSPTDLKEIGCQYVIIGHSERRRYFQETDETVNKKLKAALETGLIPIFCVGETAAERQKGVAAKRVKEQLKKGLAGLSLSVRQRIIFAYEPVWAIGTGNFCPATEAIKMHRLLKKEAMKILKHREIKTLYGGSVDEKNILEYLNQLEIDGVLVGGASAKFDSFRAILERINAFNSL